MERIKKNFGFGCMCLPMKDGGLIRRRFPGWWILFWQMALTILTLPTAIWEEKAKQR